MHNPSLSSQKPLLNQLVINLIRHNKSVEKIVVSMEGNKAWQKSVPVDGDLVSLGQESMSSSSYKADSNLNEIPTEVSKLQVGNLYKPQLNQESKFQVDKNLQIQESETISNERQKSKNQENLEKFNWRASKISLGGLNLSKVPKKELKKILEETLKYANCPVGKVYNEEQKKCISIIKPSSGEYSRDFAESNMDLNSGSSIKQEQVGTTKNKIITEKKEEYENTGILKDTDAINHASSAVQKNSHSQEKLTTSTSHSLISNSNEEHRTSSKNQIHTSEILTSTVGKIKKNNEQINIHDKTTKDNENSAIKIDSVLSENKKPANDSKPCKPSPEEIRLVIEALKERFRGKKMESKIDVSMIKQEFSNVHKLIGSNRTLQVVSSKPSIDINSYARLDTEKILDKFKNNVNGNLKNASSHIEHKNLFENTRKEMNDGFKAMSHEFDNKKQIISKSVSKFGQSISGSHLLKIKQSDLGESLSGHAEKDSIDTNSDGSLKVTTKFHPEIELVASKSNKTMKLTPVAVSGSKASIDQMMKKLLKSSQGNTNLKTLFEQFPELKNKVTITQVNGEKEQKLSNSVESTNSSSIQIVDEGEIPLMRQTKNQFEFKPKVKILKENLPSKLIIRATLPNGQVVKVGERNLTDESLLSSNGSLTLDKLGINLKNLEISKSAKQSLQNMNFKIEKSSDRPTNMEVITKKIKPAKFKHNVPFKGSKRAGSDNESSTVKQMSESTTQKSETTEKIETTTHTQSTTKPIHTGTPKLISNLFKPVKEFKKLLKEKKRDVHKLFSLSDQDQKRSVEIPATNKEDIDKILEMGAPLMEFKSVIGKTLDSQGFLGNMLDEHETTKIPLTSPLLSTSSSEQKTSPLPSLSSVKLTTETSPITKQVTTSSNLTLLPLKVIKG